MARADRESSAAQNHMSEADIVDEAAKNGEYDATARCLGFGEHEGNCANPAGSTHSPLWCQRCDDLRRAHLEARLKTIAEGFRGRR